MRLIGGDLVAQYIYGKLISTGKIIGIAEVPKDIGRKEKRWFVLSLIFGIILDIILYIAESYHNNRRVCPLSLLDMITNDGIKRYLPTNM